MNTSKQVKAEHQATDGLVSVARAVRTRGLKGEIVANLLTDFPDRFEVISELFAIAATGEPVHVTLESHWFQRGRVVLKLSGYDSVESAAALVGCEFAVRESARVELREDQFYFWELEGADVETVGGQVVGRVREVLRTGGVEILAVEDNERDYLIPMASSILVEVDIKRKLIRIDPPEGLLEL